MQTLFFFKYFVLQLCIIKSNKSWSVCSFIKYKKIFFNGFTSSSILLDEHFKKLPGYDTREDLQLKSNLSITVPESLNRSSLKILIKGVMYVCKESSCSMLSLLFVIHVHYTNQTSKDVSCEFIHTL